MGKIKVIECDNPNCKKIMKDTRDIFKLVIKTDEYVVPCSPGPDYDHNEIVLYFCERCARDVKKSLNAIVLYDICGKIDKDTCKGD